jgi:enoyl-CoA hydratase
MSEGPVQVRHEQGVAWVTIDRPPVNALDFPGYAAIADALHQAARDGAHCAVLGTAGKHFIAGHDRGEFGDAGPGERRRRFATSRASFAAVGEVEIPVIAAIKGACLGSGVVIASRCDIRLADPTAMFGFPELDLGVLGGARHLMEIAPEGLAKLMFYTGRKVGADRLLAAGALDAVFPAEDFDREVAAIASEIAARPKALLRKAKEVLYLGRRLPVDVGYWLEQQETLGLLEDALEDGEDR